MFRFVLLQDNKGQREPAFFVGHFPTLSISKIAIFRNCNFTDVNTPEVCVVVLFGWLFAQLLGLVLNFAFGEGWKAFLTLPSVCASTLSKFQQSGFFGWGFLLVLYVGWFVCCFFFFWCFLALLKITLGLNSCLIKDILLWGWYSPLWNDC